MRIAPSPVRSFGSGGTSRTSPHRLALRLALPFGEEGARQSLQRCRLLSCRSRGARARARSAFRLHDALRSLTGFTPATSRSLGSAARLRDRSFRLGSGSLSLAILPARSLARRHSCGDPGGLGHLSGSAWARSGGDPGHLDRCLLLTDVVFKDDASVSAHVASSFPTRCESRRFHASDSLRRSGRSRWSVVLSRRRSAGVPLMPRRPRARPGRAMSAGVGPRSQAISGRNPKA